MSEEQGAPPEQGQCEAGNDCCQENNGDQQALETVSRPKLAAIGTAKELRRQLDATLQSLKIAQLNELCSKNLTDGAADVDNPGEVAANAKLAQRHVEDAIMRLGMVLKSLGTTNPYPQSYNPVSSAIEPTADGLKL